MSAPDRGKLGWLGLLYSNILVKDLFNIEILLSKIILTIFIVVNIKMCLTYYTVHLHQICLYSRNYHHRLVLIQSYYGYTSFRRDTGIPRMNIRVWCRRNLLHFRQLRFLSRLLWWLSTVCRDRPVRACTWNKWLEMIQLMCMKSKEDCVFDQTMK